MLSSVQPPRRAAAPARPAAAPASGEPAVAKPAAPPPADTLTTSAAPAKRLGLREQMAAAERLSGKPARFKDEAELTAYLRSLEAAKPQAAYDRDGFLASLGVTGVRASGRTDGPTLQAVRAVPGYRPETHMANGKDIWVQQRFFDLLRSKPETFERLTHVANPVIESKGKLQGDWKKPFAPRHPAKPTGVPVADRYRDALAKLPAPSRFESDFHGGIPTVSDPGHPTYGTYTIARTLGFSDAAARRFGGNSVGIDYNETPYGKTSPSPLDQIQRHFNLDRDAQDTRLVYAKRHLETAIALAKQTSYDEAEEELGAGLHSLQDLFAHGQLSPAVHGVLGQFPDEVDWNPVGFYEATAATGAYLQAYLRAIAAPEGK